MIYMSRSEKKCDINKRIKIKVKSNLNIGVVVLILLISILFIRVGNVLKDNKERGAFAYVQLLNLGMPIIQSQVYDEGTYAENKLSLKNVCFEVLGLNNISYKGIIQNEISFFYNIDNNDTKSTFTFNPFQVSEDSISKLPANE